jgi:hypothetical protein
LAFITLFLCKTSGSWSLATYLFQVQTKKCTLTITLGLHISTPKVSSIGHVNTRYFSSKY